MVLQLLLLVQWTSQCSSLSSLTVCEVSSNVEVNSVSVDCHGRSLTEIPKHFPANTSAIDLSYNRISSVTNHSFHGISSLQSLDLSNNVISNIEALAFQNCRSLKTLKIKDNRVCVNDNVFETLGNLRELTIDDCYAAELFKPLIGLINITINVNYRCSFKGFQYLTNLRKLFITGVFSCQNNTFVVLRHLNIQFLKIEANIPRMDCNALAPLKHLKELIFSYTRTGLSKPLDALYALAGRKLTTLVMDGAISHSGSKHFEELQDRTLTKERMKYLCKICVQDFSAKNNLILYFDFVFVMNSPIGKCLKHINLRQNMITTFPMQSLFELWKLRQLESLDLSYQADVPHIDSTKGKNLTLSSSLEAIHENGEVNLKFPENLKEIDLRRCARHMEYMDFDVIILNGERVQKIDFAFNGLSTMKYIHGLPNLDLIDMSGNENLILPENFFCTFKKLRTLRLTDMSLRQNQIDTQAIKLFQCLPTLRILDISGNRLIQLPSDLFTQNPLLESLDLSRNIFISIPVHLNLLPNLHLLDVSSNSFGSFNRKTTFDIDMHYENTNKNFQLNLEGNFLECSCKNFPFLLWLSETEVLEWTKETLFCIKENGNITKTREITANVLKFWRECKGSETFFITSVLGTLLLCCTLFVLLVETNKTKLAFLIINILKNQGQRNRRRDFKRDVYVSYADMDYRWACHELCAILEKRNLSLFIWDRDAVPGDCTAEVITENVNQCWKTILFFTENYEQDAWGYLTTMAAVNSVDNLNPERLILLLPENENPRVPECLLQVVPESCIFHVPPEVRRNDAFWDDLERAIKRET